MNRTRATDRRFADSAYSESRFPRTLADAFADERSEAIQHWPRPLRERVGDVLMACLLGLCGAALLVQWWSS